MNTINDQSNQHTQGWILRFLFLIGLLFQFLSFFFKKSNFYRITFSWYFTTFYYIFVIFLFVLQLLRLMFYDCWLLLVFYVVTGISEIRWVIVKSLIRDSTDKAMSSSYFSQLSGLSNRCQQRFDNEEWYVSWEQSLSFSACALKDLIIVWVSLFVYME